MEFKDISGAVLTFVLIGMILGVGLVVLFTLEKNVTPTITGKTTVTWASIGSNLTIQNMKTVTSITNRTGAAIGATNYTVTATDGERNSNGIIVVVDNVTGIAGCTMGGSCNVTYTYLNFAGEAPAATAKVSASISEFSNNWLLIIMVVIAAAIVIGVIISSFGNKVR